MELVIVALGLSMDAFAAALCKGLCMKRFSTGRALLVALFFGFFQGGMPVLGWLLGTRFESSITGIDHWLAFILLVLIGFNLIRDALSSAAEDECSPASCSREDFSLKELILLAVATSIDALAVGITFAFLGVRILSAGLLIALVTFALSFIGVGAGFRFGSRFRKPAEIAGGSILILIGVRILSEHMGILG